MCEYFDWVDDGDIEERVSVVELWLLGLLSTSASWFSDSIFLLPCSKTQKVDKVLHFTLVTDNRGSDSVIHIVTTRENTELEITYTRSIVLM